MICGIKPVGLWFAWLGFVASQPDVQVQESSWWFWRVVTQASARGLPPGEATLS